MSKLSTENRFLDFSDYGRPVALRIANTLKNTSATPVHLTLAFFVSGLIAITCIWFGLSIADYGNPIGMGFNRFYHSIFYCLFAFIGRFYWH